MIDQNKIFMALCAATGKRLPKMRTVVSMVIRNLPEELHRQLKSEAALKGISLQNLILALLKENLAQTSKREFMIEKGGAGQMFIDALGHEGAERLAKAVGGKRVTIPTLKNSDRQRRNEEIRAQFTDGNYDDLALRFNISARQIRNIIGSVPRSLLYRKTMKTFENREKATTSNSPKNTPAKKEQQEKEVVPTDKLVARALSAGYQSSAKEGILENIWGKVCRLPRQADEMLKRLKKWPIELEKTVLPLTTHLPGAGIDSTVVPSGFKEKPAKDQLRFRIPQDVLQKVDDYRFQNHIPSRAKAIRELLKKVLKTPQKEKSTPGSRPINRTLLDAGDVQKLFKFKNRRTIYALTVRGLLPAVRVGRLLRFEPSAIETFVRGSRYK